MQIEYNHPTRNLHIIMDDGVSTIDSYCQDDLSIRIVNNSEIPMSDEFCSFMYLLHYERQTEFLKLEYENGL